MVWIQIRVQTVCKDYQQTTKCPVSMKELKGYSGKYLLQIFLKLIFWEICIYIWPRGFKTFLMLNSTEHEISSAHKH